MKTLTLNLHTLFEINIAYFQLLNEVFFSMDSNFFKFQGSDREKHSQQTVEWKWYEIYPSWKTAQKRMAIQKEIFHTGMQLCHILLKNVFSSGLKVTCLSAYLSLSIQES